MYLTPVCKNLYVIQMNTAFRNSISDWNCHLDALPKENWCLIAQKKLGSAIRAANYVAYKGVKYSQEIPYSARGVVSAACELPHRAAFTGVLCICLA